MKEKISVRGHLRRYLRLPLYMVIFWAGINAVVYYLDLKAGLCVTAGIAVYLGIALLALRNHKPLIVNDLVAFAQQYENAEKRMLDHLASPYLVLDSRGRIIWINEAAAELTGNKELYGRNIGSLFPEIAPNRLPSWESGGKSEGMVSYENAVYRVFMEHVSMKELSAGKEFLEDIGNEVNLTACYLYDETALQEYMQKCEDEKGVFGLAYLDNYDEALQSVEEVRKSLLIALIDRKITRYFSEYDGLVRKLEKDKYLLLMTNHSLEQLKEQRFHILDDVKTVNIGNEIPVTLSILALL